MNKLQQVFKSESKWKTFILSVALMGLGYGIYKGILDNYLAEIAGMTQFDKGVSEFFREIPGLCLVFFLAIFYTFSAEKIYKIGAVIMVAGMTLHGVLPPTKALLIVAVFVYSFGEHLQLGMRNSLAIEYAKDGKSGEASGYVGSANQLGSLGGYLVVTFAFSAAIAAAQANNAASSRPFKLFFLISAVICLIGMICAFGLSSKTETDKTKSRFYFRKKFTKFYMLEVFYGARKQVFFTFGPYVLITLYKADTVIISALHAVSAVLCFFLAPVVGRIIDKLGYRIVMIMDTVILVVVCFFYGFAHHIFPEKIAFIICCVNYLLDSVISLASMASNVYVKDISDSPEECRATISTGLSVNHLITILIALFGGWIWQKLGVEILFIVSAVLGLCNSAYAATIPKKQKC